MLGMRLTELRKEQKLTQTEIAERLHMSRSTYAQYEVDRRVPEYATLEKMADFFDVSIDYLVGRTDDRQSYQKDATEKLNEYLDFELTDEEIIKRLNFKVDNLTLSEEEVKEFISFVRYNRFMKRQQPASASKSQDS